MNLHGNLKHLHHVKHINGTEIYFCYIPRVTLVHRLPTAFKKLSPLKKFNKYKFNSHPNPALLPFRQYLPRSVWTEKHKQNRETFSSLFMVYFKGVHPLSFLFLFLSFPFSFSFFLSSSSFLHISSKEAAEETFSNHSFPIL